MADFGYGTSPDMGLSGVAEISSAAVRVRVTNPTVYGSGLTKHTRYNVLTSTTLGHFPRKEMAVWRRFSDFEWLNRRLALTFPAAIIPIFPEKRLVGSSDAAITAERAVALEAYANKVVTHAVLSHALDVLIFLDATDAGLDASKTFIEAVEKDEAESIVTRASDLVSKLGSRGDETRIVLKPDEAYVSVRRRPRARRAAWRAAVGALGRPQGWGRAGRLRGPRAGPWEACAR